MRVMKYARTGTPRVETISSTKEREISSESTEPALLHGPRTFLSSIERVEGWERRVHKSVSAQVANVHKASGFTTIRSRGSRRRIVQKGEQYIAVVK